MGQWSLNTPLRALDSMVEISCVRKRRMQPGQRNRRAISAVMSDNLPVSLNLFALPFHHDLYMGGHGRMQFDWHSAFAQVFDGVIEFDFTPVNVDFMVLL